MTGPLLTFTSLRTEVAEDPQNLGVEPHHRHGDAEGSSPRLGHGSLVAHPLLGVVEIHHEVHGSQHNAHGGAQNADGAEAGQPEMDPKSISTMLMSIAMAKPKVEMMTI